MYCYHHSCLSVEIFLMHNKKFIMPILLIGENIVWAWIVCTRHQLFENFWKRGMWYLFMKMDKWIIQWVSGMFWLQRYVMEDVHVSCVSILLLIFFFSLSSIRWWIDWLHIQERISYIPSQSTNLENETAVKFFFFFFPTFFWLIIYKTSIYLLHTAKVKNWKCKNSLYMKKKNLLCLGGIPQRSSRCSRKWKSTR